MIDQNLFNKLRLGLLAMSSILIISIPSIATAQIDMGGVPTVLPGNYVLDDIINQQRIESSIGTRNNQGSSAVTSRNAGARSSNSNVAANTITTYRASPAVTARVKSQWVDFVREHGGADEATKIELELDRRDFKSMWTEAVSADGFRSGDVVDALAAYWIMNWYIANGQTESTAAQAEAVRRQVRSMTAGNPAIGQLNEAQRQEMAETLMINFVFQKVNYVLAMQANDQDRLQRLATAAQGRFRNEMGVDLRQLRLTDQGFVSGD